MHFILVVNSILYKRNYDTITVYIWIITVRLPLNESELV